MFNRNSSKKKNANDEDELTPWQKEHFRYLQERQGSEEKEKSSDEQTENRSESSETKQTDHFAEKDYKEQPEKKRISFADRLPKLKNHRNKKLHKRLFTIIIIFTIPLLLTLYYISPLSSLAAVNVTGNQNVASQKIVASSGLQVKQNLWGQYFDRDQFSQRIIKKFPRIKEAQIKFSSLNQFKIDVTEHQEVSLLSKDGEYFPILENGQVVNEPEEKADKDKIILEDFTQRDQIMPTIENYHELPKEIQSGISQINYTPSENNDELLTLFMNDGNRVILNISNMDEQMNYYPQVAEEMEGKGVIDMEVGIFAHPYDENQTEDDEEQEGSE
ncbi:MAG: FtsQ-type POTRA domain-containing protein [Tetragenococcus sp.]|nr:FtsQ-type POTRA domain-containing protein [Tetragenococcus sp.]